MALEAPVRPSSTILMPTTFSPHNDMSSSHNDSQSLRPTSFMGPNSNHLMSPSSDIVGPSPVTSNGTETTEIEDDASSETGKQAAALDHNAPPQLRMLKTNISDALRQTLSEEAVSVIHAPQEFQQWASPNTKTAAEKPHDIISPPESVASTRQLSNAHPPPPPLFTNIKPARYSLETATPQAQNLQDVMSESSRLRSSSASSLELIPETAETDTEADAEGDEEEEDLPIDHRRTSLAMRDKSEIRDLKTALEQSWSLCNTLSSMSSQHRDRVFNNSGTPDAQDKAWKSCWKLCQNLYSSRDEAVELHHMRTNLDLCRDFCQALFDIRQRMDDAGDSVLRVSFELNNHLYSAQDSRNLPEAFRERTLDFYITLCHRLMKQRGDGNEETDSLLRACWSLAEMLFSIRQNARDGKAADVDIYSSAVQACWELCDIFREGWSQVRPDRGTPRPSQVTFFGHGNASSSDVRSAAGSRVSIHSKRDSLRSSPDGGGGGGGSSRRKAAKQAVPETPVTEFEDTGDTPISAGSNSPQLPNILVLGPTSSDNHSQSGSKGGRWSSSASNMSSYSQSSAKTSSTATTATSAEDVNVTRIKVLIVKAAMNIGFSRDMADTSSSKSGKAGQAVSLQSFVKSLPTGSFGPASTQATLLQKYKDLVLADNAFRHSATLPTRGKRVHATDVAKSVGWMMMRSGQYQFLRDLYKLVFGFTLEESEGRKSVSIAI